MHTLSMVVSEGLTRRKAAVVASSRLVRFGSVAVACFAGGWLIVGGVSVAMDRPFGQVASSSKDGVVAAPPMANNVPSVRAPGESIPGAPEVSPESREKTREILLRDPALGSYISSGAATLERVMPWDLATEVGSISILTFAEPTDIPAQLPVFAPGDPTVLDGSAGSKEQWSADHLPPTAPSVHEKLSQVEALFVISLYSEARVYVAYTMTYSEAASFGPVAPLEFPAG